MQKGGKFFAVFIVFFVLSVIIFGLSKTGIFSKPSAFLNSIFSPVQARFLSSVIGARSISSENLKEENLKLAKEVSDYQKLKKQNASLMDQFQSSGPKNSTLLPADVVGAPGFIPGLSVPESFVINKGLLDNVKVGDAVVFKDSVIGKILKTSQNLSSVILITSAGSSFTAKTGQNKPVLGVVNGQGGGEMTLDNVLLSENLKNGDLIFTNGDVNLNGEGLPPGLIVGKIISVEKSPSALFQKADVEALIDFTKLSTVFVITGK